ncbi:MAG: hypothetical protein JWO60_2158 [Frankiales bacterium]|nr:hypothetical protein [Frankiales bacterium]
MDAQPWQVRIAPGPGQVARYGSTVVVARPEGAAQDDFVTQVLALVRTASEEHPDEPGRRLVRQVAGLLAQAEPDDVPALCVVSQASEGVGVLLAGDVDVDVAGRDVQGERLSGRDVGTWVDRLLRTPFTSLSVLARSASPADPRTALEAGVVAGDGVLVLPVAVAAAAWSVVPAQRPAATPTPPVPVPEPAPAAAPPHVVELPTQERAPVASAAVLAARSTVGAAAAAAPAPAVFLSALLDDGGTDEERSPLPVLGERAVPEPEGPVPVQVMGISCSRQHFNDPSSTYCAQCGISMVHQTHNLVPGPRPPLGVVVLDDGAIFTLTEDYVLGREPQGADEVVDGLALPLVLEDPDRSLSRVHAMIQLRGWDVRLVDVHSANGTFLSRPGEQEWTRLPPDEPTTIRPGTRVTVGGRSLVFDSHCRT